MLKLTYAMKICYYVMSLMSNQYLIINNRYIINCKLLYKMAWYFSTYLCLYI